MRSYLEESKENKRVSSANSVGKQQDRSGAVSMEDNREGILTGQLESNTSYGDNAPIQGMFRRGGGILYKSKDLILNKFQNVIPVVSNALRQPVHQNDPPVLEDQIVPHQGGEQQQRPLRIDRMFPIDIPRIQNYLPLQPPIAEPEGDGLEGGIDLLDLRVPLVEATQQDVEPSSDMEKILRMIDSTQGSRSPLISPDLLRLVQSGGGLIGSSGGISEGSNGSYDEEGDGDSGDNIIEFPGVAYFGLGIEGAAASLARAQQGDVIVVKSDSFWEGADPNHLTGQTWKNIGPFLIHAGFGNFLMSGSEGLTIDSLVKYYGDKYVPVKAYQRIFDQIREDLESRDVEIIYAEVMSQERVGDESILDLSNGRILAVQSIEDYRGPGDERGEMARGEQDDQDSVSFSTGADMIQSPFLPEGDVAVVGGGPTGAWVIEEALLNLGFEKRDWTLRDPSFPQQGIKWIIRPKVSLIKDLELMSESTPRLRKIITKILDGEVPVDLIDGTVDVTRLPKRGEALEYTSGSGEQESLDGIGHVVSAMGQSGEAFYESRNESYWKNSLLEFGNLEMAGKKLNIVRGIMGSDGTFFGISKSISILTYASGNATDPNLQGVATRALNLIRKNWSAIEAIDGVKENPMGGIAHLLAAQKAKPSKYVPV